MFFLVFFLFNHPWSWNVLESERPLRFWRHIGWRNTKIGIHGTSQMGWKRVTCGKLKLFKGKLRVFRAIWVKWKQSVCSTILFYSSTFYSLFLSFFILEIFKFKYDKFFVRHSTSISKFKWSEQVWTVVDNELSIKVKVLLSEISKLNDLGK